MADDTVTVTQADREAAMKSGLVGGAEFTRHLETALARHRLATEARPASTVPSDVVAASTYERLGQILRREKIKPTARYLDAAYLGYNLCRMERAVAALSQGRDGLVEALAEFRQIEASPSSRGLVFDLGTWALKHSAALREARS